MNTKHNYSNSSIISTVLRTELKEPAALYIDAVQLGFNPNKVVLH